MECYFCKKDIICECQRGREMRKCLYCKSTDISKRFKVDVYIFECNECGYAEVNNKNRNKQTDKVWGGTRESISRGIYDTGKEM